MARPDLNRPLVPGFDVLISGESYAMAFHGNLRALMVEDDLTLPGMFTIELVGSVGGRRELPWLDDDPRITLGGQVEIRFGWQDRFDTVIRGEITAIEPEFGADRMPVMRLRGYDGRQRLQRGTRTRTFAHSKDSDIVAQVGREAGLTVSAEDSGITHDYIVQANQTDMEFLLRRAAAIGFEILMRDGKLLFRPQGFDAGADMTLSVDDDLLEFSASCSIAHQVGQVNVYGWDVKTKDVLTAQAGTGSERSVMEGTASGAWVERVLGTQTVHHFGDSPIAVREEADALARSRFDEASLSLVTAEALVLGRSDLRAGSVVRIDGAGTRFSGPYYVHSVRHRYTPLHGYTTRFSARRNAL